MGNFKVGQWVRALVNWGSIEKGKVYQIPHLDNDGEPWFTPDGSGGWTDYLSLDEIEPWTPRVGERVRMIKTVDGHKAECGATVVHTDGSKLQPYVIDLDKPHGWAHSGRGYAKAECGWWVAADDIEPLIATAEALRATDDRADAGGGFKAGDKIRLVKSAIKGSRTIGKIYGAVKWNGISAETSVNFVDDKGDHTWAPGEYFELHKPIQIEAGKFYKTRDGRKVGPMAQLWGTWRDADRRITSQSWFADGTFIQGLISQLDLISEWVEPASNDNAPVAQKPAAKPAKFKVGDKIRHKHLGHEGFVEALPCEGYVKVQWPSEGWGATDPEGDLELIVTPVAPTPTAIVALIENGKPKPAVRPHVHASAELAQKEADRLANKFKGKQFGVYVLSSISEQAKPVYDHKWQRLAAEGLKIDAIKELRGITGMGLKPAKDAVEYFLQAA